MSQCRRWWKRYRVHLKLKRNPRHRDVLRRAIFMYSNRIKLRRKRRAIALIKTFLEDCSGLSETMRKIYSFRQSVIKVSSRKAKIICIFSI